LPSADELTPSEIALAVDVESEKQKDFYKMMAYIVYTGASLNAIGFNDPKKFPPLEEAFPSLFEKKEQQDWWVMKERVEKWAKQKNI
jgi:hypothetical protein